MLSQSSYNSDIHVHVLHIVSYYVYCIYNIGMIFLKYILQLQYSYIQCMYHNHANLSELQNRQGIINFIILLILI